jgi:hypothetical protein
LTSILLSIWDKSKKRKNEEISNSIMAAWPPKRPRVAIIGKENMKTGLVVRSTNELKNIEVYTF